jgi:hypothetical protein
MTPPTVRDMARGTTARALQSSPEYPVSISGVESLISSRDARRSMRHTAI